MEFSFNGEYDKKEFIQALKLTERTKLWAKLARYLALLFAALVAFQAVYIFLYDSPNGFEIARLGRHIFTVILLGTYYISPILALKRNVDASFSNAYTRPMRGRVTLEGIVVKGSTPGREGLFQWNRFIHKGKQENFIALRTIDNVLLLFRDHYFENKADWQRFEQMVDKNVIEPK